MKKLLFFLLVPLLFALLLVACVHRYGPSSSGPLEVYRHGHLDEEQADVADVVYVHVKDKNGLMPDLRNDVASRLQLHHIVLTDNPSQAGYILQISLMACGLSSAEEVRSVVNAGYGAPARLNGQGTTAVVADALLVLRRVPRADSKQALRTISNRQALASSQIRIGLLAHRRLDSSRALPPDMADTLAAEICTPIMHHATGADPHAAAAGTRQTP